MNVTIAEYGALLAVLGLGISLSSLLFSVYSLYQSILDACYVAQAGVNGQRRIIVKMHLRNTVLRLLIQALLVWRFLLLTGVDTDALTGRVILLAVSILVLATVIADWSDRRRLLGSQFDPMHPPSERKWDGTERRRES